MIRIAYASRAQVWLGRAFLAAAGASAIGALAGPGIVGIDDPIANTPFRVTSAICAGIFLIPGLVLAFTDREVVVDRARGVMALGTRWLRWKRMVLHPIEANAHVELSKREMQAGRYAQTLYPVHYVHSRGRPEVTSLSVYRLSRGRAEALARALDLPLVDRSGGEVVRRAAADLDRSAADPATLPEGLRWRPLPKDARVRARFARDALEIAIPPPGFDAGAGFGLGLLGFALYLAWMVATVTVPQLDGVGDALLGVLIGAIVLLLGAGGAFLFAERVAITQRVRVTTAGIERLGFRGRPKGTLEPAEGIEEVLLDGDATGVIARTDAGEIPLAHSVRRAEAAWIRDAVHLTLAGRPPRARPRA